MTLSETRADRAPGRSPPSPAVCQVGKAAARDTLSPAGERVMNSKGSRDVLPAAMCSRGS